MNSLQRNLWILVTLSALAIILQNAFFSMNAPADISMTYTYSSENEKIVKWEKKSCKQHASYPDVDEFVAVDKLPSATNFPAVSASIAYPAYAREKGMEGTVLARILVDEKGNYVQHKILKADNCGMRYNVEKEISRLSFIPAEKDGEKVAVWVSIPFNFRLK